VAELIQNADDNTYLASAVPTLSIRSDATCITTINNEVVCCLSHRCLSHRLTIYVRMRPQVGFSPSDLTALCNVGCSSKSGEKGKIGKKGIGFKVRGKP
jgi:hypothetical protein